LLPLTFKVLIENYNSRPHRTLSQVLGAPAAPLDVTAKKEELLRAADMQRAARLAERTHTESGVGEGTRVRLLAARMRRSRGSALGNKRQDAVWSSDAYPVIMRAGFNSFLVDVPAGENKVWPLHSSRSLMKLLKVIWSAVSAKRLESYNISPAENAAALKAPASAKRVSKLTPKAAALLTAVARPARVVSKPARYL
jgi:hypothetical protein